MMTSDGGGGNGVDVEDQLFVLDWGISWAISPRG